MVKAEQFGGDGDFAFGFAQGHVNKLAFGGVRPIAQDKIFPGMDEVGVRRLSERDDSHGLFGNGNRASGRANARNVCASCG